MTDFSTKEQLSDKLNEYNLNNIGKIGEVVVALQFLDVFKEEIDKIQISSNKVDLTIKFKNTKKSITVEVKSSSFKNDYFIDRWKYGVPIKSKDFGYNFDLLAMVNFIPPNNSINKICSDHQNVTVSFRYNELETLPPNPFMFLPTTTLLKLKNECDDINKFRTFFNNYYKGLKIDPSIIFDEVGFSLDNYKITNKWKGKLGFPSWFDKSLSCKYLAEYANKDKEFYKREILSKWKTRINLELMVKNAITHEHNKSRINEEYIIDPSYCKNCAQKCKYIPVRR